MPPPNHRNHRFDMDNYRGNALSFEAWGEGKWSGRPDSNRRRSAWEADILPLNYARFPLLTITTNRAGNATTRCPCQDRYRFARASTSRYPGNSSARAMKISPASCSRPARDKRTAL